MSKWNQHLNKNSKYIQGKLTEHNLTCPEKFKNNPKIMVFRSSYERIFVSWLDTNEGVISWACEVIDITYYNPVKKRFAKYYPDFFVETKSENWLVEIKPSSQIKKPSSKKWKQLQTWMVNQEKWKAAQKFCEEKKWKFVIITEKNLKC
jgi:hypothetical protein